MNIIGFTQNEIYIKTVNGVIVKSIIYPLFKPIIKIIDSIHGCYLLKSEISIKTYFGYTVNIIRRLRQHNGIIVGGAKHTKKGRPWKLVAHITGFPNSTVALQFEWKINHPASIKYDSEIYGSLKNSVNFPKKEKSKKKNFLLENRIFDINYMILEYEKIYYLKLSVQWY